jgi:hypothetical protein
MTLTSVSTDNTGDADNCISLTTATGTLTMNGGALVGGNSTAFPGQWGQREYHICRSHYSEQCVSRG